MSKLRIGIFGAGRGAGLGKAAVLAGAEIVAICDFHQARLEKALESFEGEIATYDDFDKFIEHPMDGVILANYFHEHAPFAIKCLEKGVNVFSECISNGTMAEGVQLERAAQKSSAIYMLAENYPNALCTREIKKICDSGTLGKILYAEGEYNHPSDPTDLKFKKKFNYFPEHWRNYTPRTYYLTHSLCPVMAATGATPKRVSAFAVYAPETKDVATVTNVGDRAAVLLTQNDDGSVFRLTGCAGFGAHGNSYRVCGLNGQVEQPRGFKDKVLLRYNAWTLPEGAVEEKLYTPSWDDEDEALIIQTGHGGGDFMVVRKFLDCIREGKQPEFPYDVHSAVTMSSTAILAHRSMLEGGTAYEVPDFRKAEDCAKYENDYLTPFIGEHGEKPTLPCCSHPEHKPTQEQARLFHELVMEVDGSAQA